MPGLLSFLDLVGCRGEDKAVIHNFLYTVLENASEMDTPS